jgi:hypothetical protein
MIHFPVSRIFQVLVVNELWFYKVCLALKTKFLGVLLYCSFKGSLLNTGLNSSFQNIGFLQVLFAVELLWVFGVITQAVRAVNEAFSTNSESVLLN